MIRFNRLGLAGGLVAAALAAMPAGAETVHFRMAVETTPGDPTNLMLAAFRDELQASAGSSVTIDFYDGGSLGDENALAEMIRAGVVDVIPLGTDGVVAMDKGFALFDTPFLFADKASARAALDGKLGELMASSLREKSGLQVLAFGELGVRVVSNGKRAIEEPEDLQGLKLRTPNSQTRIMAFQMLGAAPITLPLGEVYMGLRQGLIDGQENPLSVIKEFSLHEVQPYIALTNHIYTPITLVMNGQRFDALSPEMKEMVMAAARKAVEVTRAVSDQSDETLVAEFEAAGVTVTRPDIAAFREAAAPIREKIAEVVTPEFMTQVEAALQ